MSLKEKDLYEPIKEALERSFAAIGRRVVSGTAATKGLGEPFKALIPKGNEILFRFLLNNKPDIAGYVEHPQGHKTLVAEVKRSTPILKDIYQAKLYKEVFGATFGFLVTVEQIPEEVKRLLSNSPWILMSANDHPPSFLALAQFNPDTASFVDWYSFQSGESDPINHLKKLSF